MRLEVLVEVPAVAAARVVVRFGDADPAAPGVVGAASHFNTSLFSEASTALSVQIFGNATSSFVAAQDRAWGAALTLVLLTFLLTLVARVVTARFALKR